MDGPSIADLVSARFPAAEVEIVKGSPRAPGLDYVVAVLIEPLTTVEDTRDLAQAKLSELLQFLVQLKRSFGSDDRVWLIVGFPESVKKTQRRVLKGWLPAARLGEATLENFATLGGSLAENRGWTQGLGLPRNFNRRVT